MKNKVILIRPQSAIGIVGKMFTQYPLTLAYLAAPLREDNFDVEIWDYEAEIFNSVDFSNRLKQSQPDIVALTSMTPNIHLAHQIALLTKSVLPYTKTIIGGHHATALPSQTLKEFSGFDFVVIGEGEATLLELCRAIREEGNCRDIPSLGYRDKEGVVLSRPRPLIDDLDSLKMPARDLFDFKLYQNYSPTPGIFKYPLKAMQIFTSRGCFGRCIFCASHNTFGRKVRLRSAAIVNEEVNECVVKFGINHFTIDDDTFCSDYGRLEKICENFRRHKLSWDCDTRVNLITHDVIKLMAQSGCLKIAFGVESGSPRILGLIGKDITLEQIRNAFSWAGKYRIVRQAFMMIGSHPSETLEDLEESSALIQEIKPDLVTFSIAVPYPGTELFGLLNQKGLIESSDWSNFQFYHGRVSWRTENFESAQLIDLQRKMLYRFYLNPVFLARQFRNLNNFGLVTFYAKAAKDFIKFIIQRKKDRLKSEGQIGKK